MEINRTQNFVFRLFIKLLFDRSVRLYPHHSGTNNQNKNISYTRQHSTVYVKCQCLNWIRWKSVNTIGLLFIILFSFLINLLFCLLIRVSMNAQFDKIAYDMWFYVSRWKIVNIHAPVNRIPQGTTKKRIPMRFWSFRIPNERTFSFPFSFSFLGELFLASTGMRENNLKTKVILQIEIIIIIYNWMTSCSPFVPKRVSPVAMPGCAPKLPNQTDLIDFKVLCVIKNRLTSNEMNRNWNLKLRPGIGTNCLHAFALTNWNLLFWFLLISLPKIKERE